MDTQQAYDQWAAQYDSNSNKTRDLEGLAMRSVLAGIEFNKCLEIGCGTGKNTMWFVEEAKQVTAVDFSAEMLARAKEKVKSSKVQFFQADITAEWTFINGLYDLVSFSLVLEHISNLDHVFSEAANALVDGGYVYIGELHPFKQYKGTKARYDTLEGQQQVLECFNHHISDFTTAAKKHGLQLVDLDEFFDSDDRSEVPRILTLILKKA
jgi:ubiquinone/menaquinone biosynthesis C-methylase UbiE